MQTFKLGDTVRVKNGPHISFTGEVKGINQAKALLKVVREVLNPNPTEGLFVLESISVSFADAENVSQT